MTHSKRFDYIDIARGICIAFMVVGHCYSTDSEAASWFIAFFYSFHVPFFFILSGVLAHIKEMNTNQADQPAIRSILIRKTRTVLLPYMVWGSLYLLFLAALAIIGGADPKAKLFDSLTMFLRFTGSAMWFLPVFFLASVLLSLLQRLPRFALVAVGTAVILLGLYLNDFKNSYILFLIHAAVGLGFMAIGYTLPNILFREKQKWFVLLPFVMIDAFAIIKNGCTSLVGNVFGDPLLYLLTGILGSWLVIQIAMRLPERFFLSRGWQKLGKYSIIILCLHQFVIHIIRLIDYKLFGDLLPRTGFFEGIILSALTLTILYFCIPLILRLFWWSFGLRSPWKKKETESS